MLSHNISNFSSDGWNSKLKDKLLGNLRHKLGKFDLILSLINLLPLISKNFGNLHSLD